MLINECNIRITYQKENKRKIKISDLLDLVKKTGGSMGKCTITRIDFEEDRSKELGSLDIEFHSKVTRSLTKFNLFSLKLPPFSISISCLSEKPLMENLKKAIMEIYDPRANLNT